MYHVFKIFILYFKKIVESKNSFCPRVFKVVWEPVDINVVTINQNTFTVLEISNFTILDEKIS